MCVAIVRLFSRSSRGREPGDESFRGQRAAGADRERGQAAANRPGKQWVIELDQGAAFAEKKSGQRNKGWGNFRAQLEGLALVHRVSTSRRVRSIAIDQSRRPRMQSARWTTISGFPQAPCRDQAALPTSIRSV